MKTPLACLGAALAMLGLGSTAVANTYIGLGIGTEAPITGQLGQMVSTDDSTHGRLILGSGFGPLALEGSLFGTGLEGDQSILALGVDLKYTIGIAGGFGVYLKGGLHRAYLQSENAWLDQYEGNGYQYGVGAQYRFDLAVSSAALWLDYTRSRFELDDRDAAPLEGTGKLLTIGLSIGF